MQPSLSGRERTVSRESVPEAAAKRRKNTAHGASRGSLVGNEQAPKGRKRTYDTAAPTHRGFRWVGTRKTNSNLVSIRRRHPKGRGPADARLQAEDPRSEGGEQSNSLDGATHPT